MRVLALAGLSISLIAPAVAEIESEFHVGYSSDYVFRGANQGGDNDLYEFGLDFGGSGTAPVLGDVDWSAGVWYGSFGSNELDVYGEVSKSLNEMLSVAVGITSYSYFGAGNAGANPADDIEPYISLGTSLAGISLGVGAHFDESDTKTHDIYWEITAAYEKELSGNMTLGLSAVLGHFDETAAGVDDTYYALGAALSIAASDSITVTPHVTHIIDGSTGDETVGGVSVGFGF
ncbi:MAG: hypothetical protein VCA34_11740 [Roseibacillus sp.]